MSAVLDAWALLALALGEAPAAERVLALLDDAALGGPFAAMSRINLGEAY